MRPTTYPHHTLGRVLKTTNGMISMRRILTKRSCGVQECRGMVGNAMDCVAADIRWEKLIFSQCPRNHGGVQVRSSEHWYIVCLKNMSRINHQACVYLYQIPFPCHMCQTICGQENMLSQLVRTKIHLIKMVTWKSGSLLRSRLIRVIQIPKWQHLRSSGRRHHRHKARHAWLRKPWGTCPQRSVMWHRICGSRVYQSPPFSSF